MISTQKNCQTLQKGTALCKLASMKKLWNTGGGQEMAVMVGQWQKFNNGNQVNFVPIPDGMRQHKSTY